MNQTILAIDQNRFDIFSNLSVSLEEPEQRQVESLKCGAPAAPDAGRVHLGGTVLFDPMRSIFRMWYVAFPRFDGDLHFNSHIAYAESVDGINWVKPNLCLIEYNGSLENNLVAGLPGGSDGISVILDNDGLFKAPVMNVSVLTPEMIADPILKAGCDKVPMPAFMGIAVSSDGVNWNFEATGQPSILEKMEVCRLSKTATQYIMAAQQMKPWCEADDYTRVVTFFESSDLRTWRKRPGFYRSESGCQCHVGIAPLTQVGETMLGLVGRFYDAPELPDQTFEVDLVISNDNCNWRIPCKGTPYLRRGAVRSWNGGGILQSQGLAERGDDMLIYFSGGDMGNEPFSQLSAGIAIFKRHRFGYAAIKVGWDIGFSGIRHGYLRTGLIKNTNRYRISLNCSNFKQAGMLRGALTDGNGIEIEGFSLDKSIPIMAGDSLSMPLQWNTNEPELPKEFCIKIEFSGGIFRSESPRLYAINLEER